MPEIARPLRVMIVDDDPLIRTVFADQLNAQPPVTVIATAEDGLTALDLLDQEDLAIDAALIDVDMPGLSGTRTAYAVIQGLTNRRLANRLGLSENTARVYVSELLHRLGYSSRTELMAAHMGQ